MSKRRDMIEECECCHASNVPGTTIVLGPPGRVEKRVCLFCYAWVGEGIMMRVRSPEPRDVLTAVLGLANELQRAGVLRMPPAAP